MTNHEKYKKELEQATKENKILEFCRKHIPNFEQKVMQHTDCFGTEYIRELNRWLFTKCHEALAHNDSTESKENEIEIPAIDSRIKSIADYYGIESQLAMVVEECAELIMAIQKYNRGTPGIDNLIEETADVQIMIEQLTYMVSAKKVAKKREEKIERQLQRIADEQQAERWIK